MATKKDKTSTVTPDERMRKLDEWLFEKHSARSMWQIDHKFDSGRSVSVEMFIINIRPVLVVRYDRGRDVQGWDVFVQPTASTKIEETLLAAERHLGLLEPSAPTAEESESVTFRLTPAGIEYVNSRCPEPRARITHIDGCPVSLEGDCLRARTRDHARVNSLERWLGEYRIETVW